MEPRGGVNVGDRWVGLKSLKDDGGKVVSYLGFLVPMWPLVERMSSAGLVGWDMKTFLSIHINTIHINWF